jgi:hypothetical protein
MAKALVIDNNYMTSDVMLFKNNTFESDDTGIRLGYTDAGGSNPVNNLLFVNNQIKKSSEGVPRSFTSFILGYWTETLSNDAFIGTTFINGATSAITWSGSGQKSVAFGSELTVAVADGSGNPIAGATVQVTDGTGRLIGAGATDARGNLVLDIVTTSYLGTTSPTATNSGPFTLSIGDTGYQPVTMPLTLTQNKRINVTLNRS